MIRFRLHRNVKEIMLRLNAFIGNKLHADKALHYTDRCEENSAGGGSVHIVFIDSPYGANICYSEYLNNIGWISPEIENFYKELEKVMKECQRVLKPGKILGWLISDKWVK